MSIDTITEPLLDFYVRIISHKFYHSSRLNNVPCIAVDVSHKLVKKDHTYDLSKLMFQQINENLGAIRKTKGAQCKFGSILKCMLFYIMKEFPSIGKVKWDQGKTIAEKINDYIEQMGDNFDAQMTSYFEDFKKSMKQRMRIPVSLIKQYEKEIFFLVDIDDTYIQEVIPRVRWLRPLGYELDVDQASATIVYLLVEEIDKNAKHFGTYDIVKSKVMVDLKTATTVKKKDKLVRKIKRKFGVEGEGTSDEEESDNEHKEDEPQGLTQGLGEDTKEGFEEDEAKEAQIRTKVTKRKAKAPPTPQPKEKKVVDPAPKRLTTRATTQKAQLEAEEKTTSKPRKRRKYVAQPHSDEEETELEDINEFKVVSHAPQTIMDKLCSKIRSDDLEGLKNLNFSKLTKEEKIEWRNLCLQ